ncbi:MAG: DegT/DnrJ/EryC1/StrS family aminotransferase, partial [Phycisphaerae bacterium]|nr:DegT/DnrJ/EryC1/StrS family aminotransferase [Phycisphaerae bacterium]
MNYKPINLSSQDITSAEIDAVMEVMRSDRLSIGPRLDAFEAALAARVGRKYGIA